MYAINHLRSYIFKFIDIGCFFQIAGVLQNWGEPIMERHIRFPFHGTFPDHGVNGLVYVIPRCLIILYSFRIQCSDLVTDGSDDVGIFIGTCLCWPFGTVVKSELVPRIIAVISMIIMNLTLVMDLLMGFGVHVVITFLGLVT